MTIKRIAFQGEPGAYSEEALFLLAPDAQSQPYREFRDVAQPQLGTLLEHGLRAAAELAARLRLGTRGQQKQRLFTVGARLALKGYPLDRHLLTLMRRRPCR